MNTAHNDHGAPKLGKQAGNTWLVGIIVVLLGSMVAAGTWYVNKDQQTSSAFADLRNTLHQSRQQMQSTTRERDQTTKALAALQSETTGTIAALELKAGELQQRVDESNTRLAALQESSTAREQTLRDQSTLLSVRLDETRQANASLQQDIAGLNNRIEQETAAALTQQQQAIQAIKAMQAQKDAIEQNLAESNAARDADGLRHQKNMATTLEDLNSYRDALRQSAPEHATHLEELRSQLGSQKTELDELGETLKLANQNAQQLQQQLSTSNAELVNARAETAATEQQLRQFKQGRELEIADAATLLTQFRSEAHASQQALAKQADRAMAQLRKQNTPQAEQAKNARQAANKQHADALASMQQKLQLAIDDGAAALKTQQAAQAHLLATASKKFNATISAAEQATAGARKDFQSKLLAQQTSAHEDHEALINANSEQMKAANAAADQAMIALRSARLNNSALGAVYRQEVAALRSSVSELGRHNKTAARRQQALGEMGARYSKRGLIVTFGESELSFAPGQATATSDSIGSLDAIATFLNDFPGRGLLIEGHTDGRGSETSNQQLSEQRAASVLTALVERGVGRERIRAAGLGESRPVASNGSAEGRRKNRRVELIIVDMANLPSPAPLP